MKPLKAIAIMLCGFLLAVPSHAAQRNLAVTKSVGEQKRVALVIGNAAYQSSPLRNPVNDAKAMSDALNGLGFQVIEVTDATQKEMNRAITAFGSKLNAETAALFFYAGHGLQVKGKNYLVPVDAHIETEAAVAPESVSVDSLLEQLNASPVSIVILDACRNNPFERSFRKMGGGGLAQMDAPMGSFIAYATAPGKTAADGDGKNGLFTQELLKQISEPGLTLESVFKRVRASVAAKSGAAQTPWDSSSMTGEFYFKPGDVTQVASLVPVPVQPARVKTKEEIEDETWKTAEGANILDAYETYLATYPNGRYAAQAKIKLAVLKKQAEQGKTQGGVTQNVQQAGQSFRDCPDCPEMVKISGRNFEMGKYHVTRGEFAKFVSETNYDAGSSCWVWNGSKWEERSGSNWRNPGFTQDDNHPVVCVNWHDAQAYVSWLSKKTGRQYRLPVEAEWEYACYGGSQTEYCGGNIDTVAWYKDNSGGQTHPAGQKQANGYGLYDMRGNVWHWMENKYKYDNEHDGRALRGGSWSVDPQGVRAVIRIVYKPATRGGDIGFRLAKTLP